MEAEVVVICYFLWHHLHKRRWSLKIHFSLFPANKSLAELFQVLKDDAGKVLYSICQQIYKTQKWPQDWKRSVCIPVPKKGNAKECSNYRTIALISHASKVMLKILQTRLQQYMNRELPDVQADFRKGRGTRDQIANICWIIEKAREFQKTKQNKTKQTFTSTSLTSLWLCGSQKNVEHS